MEIAWPGEMEAEKGADVCVPEWSPNAYRPSVPSLKAHDSPEAQHRDFLAFTSFPCNPFSEAAAQNLLSF